MEEGVETLFTKQFLGDVIRHYQQLLPKDLNEISSERVINTQVDEIVPHFVDKYALDIPTLHEEGIEVESEDADVDVRYDRNRLIRDTSRPVLVKGTRFTYFVPFDGDKDIFSFRPSTYTLNPPRAEVHNQELRFVYQRTDHDTEQVKKDFDSALEEIKTNLDRMRNEAANWNAGIEPAVRAQIETRRQKLEQDRKAGESLGFPMRRRDGASKTYSIPAVKKRVAMPSPRPKASSKPEPALDMAVYEDILSIISNMAHVIERSPKAFAKMGEEDLRQHFLVQLNGQYEGQATGETFNADGKADILIRAEDRNIFIAECKFWKGAEVFTQTIDQLLGYATWRDTKIALIIFNKNKELTKVLAQIPGLLKGHPNFLRHMPYSSDTGFRSVLRHRDDKDRELILTAVFFDVPG